MIQNQNLGILPLPYVEDAAVMQRLAMQGERAELKLQLGELQVTFNEHATEDKLSQDLLAWHWNFTAALEDKGRDFYATKADFLGQLQGLLRCALPPHYSFTTATSPEEATVLIGSDGYIYDRKSLSLALSRIDLPAGEHYPSPLAPRDERPYMLKPHRLAIRMTAWLGQQGALPVAEERDRPYAELKASGLLPKLPFEQPNIRRVHMTRARLAARQQGGRLTRQDAPQLQGVPQLQDALQVNGQEMGAGAASAPAQSVPAMQAMAGRGDAIYVSSRRQRPSHDAECSDLMQRARVLKEGQKERRHHIAKLTADTGFLHAAKQSGLDAEIYALIQRDLEALELRLTELTMQTEAAFREGIQEIQSNLAVNGEISRDMAELEDHHHLSLRTEMAEICERLLGLQESGQELSASLRGLQQAMNDVEGQIQGNADLVDGLTSRESYQQELELLAEMLKAQPDPAMDLLMSFYSQMQENFAANMRSIEGLSIQDRLATMQQQIAENSMSDLTARFGQLEVACEALEQRIDTLPAAIENIRGTQAELHKQIKSVNKLLKQQKQATFDKMVKCVALAVTAAATGGGMAIFDFVMAASGMDEQLSMMTQKLTKPISAPLMKALKPVMAPLGKICKTMAPVMQFLSYVNAIEGSLSIIRSGGTFEQASMNLLQNVAPKSFSPSQFFIQVVTDPVDLLKQEILKTAAPALTLIQNVTSIIDSAENLVNSLSSAAGALQCGDGASRGGFLGACASAETACTAEEQIALGPRQETREVKGNAANRSLKGQAPSQEENAGKVSRAASHGLKPAAKVKGERTGLATPTAVPISKSKKNDFPSQRTEKPSMKPLKATVQQKTATIVAVQPLVSRKASLQAPPKIASQKNEMSIYRTAQANLSPLMSFTRQPAQAERSLALSNVNTAPTKAHAGPNALDCSWKGAFKAGIERIGEDEMAKMSPEEFKKDFVKGCIKTSMSLVKNKGSMQDPVDTEIMERIFSFNKGWIEHSEKCKASININQEK